MRHLFNGALLCVCLLIPANSILAQATLEKKQEKKSEKQEKKSDDKKKDDKKKLKTVDIEFADSQLVMQTTDNWTKVRPKFRMIAHEFKIATEVKDQPDARMTMMGAGGGVDRNIERWKGQFKQPDGKETKPKVTEKSIGDQDVTFVDITGTYIDKPIPVRPEFTERKDYRMLAAIIETDGMGNYFVKLYGNKKTIDKHEKQFYAMIDSLKVKKK